MDKFEYQIRTYKWKCYNCLEIDKKLDKMGSLGWELVVIKKNYYIFKRKLIK